MTSPHSAPPLNINSLPLHFKMAKAIFRARRSLSLTGQRAFSMATTAHDTSDFVPAIGLALHKNSSSSPPQHAAKTFKSKIHQRRPSFATVAPDIATPTHRWNLLPIELLSSATDCHQIHALLKTYAARPALEWAIRPTRPVHQRSNLPSQIQQPSPDNNQLQHQHQQHHQHRHFVFGYGSLMNVCSRLRTLPASAHGIPCLARGWRRRWDYNCRGTYTALGLSPKEGSVTNGVLVHLPGGNDDLERLDVREADYERVLINPLDIFLLVDSATTSPALQEILSLDPSSVSIWLYKSKDISHAPTTDVPLAQSYIDCCLSGARLTLGESFAKLFLRLTEWDSVDSSRRGCWVDDRLGAATNAKTSSFTPARSGRTSPTSNGLLDDLCAAALAAAVESGPRRRRYGGREIENVDRNWIDELLHEELGPQLLSARVLDTGFGF